MKKDLLISLVIPMYNEGKALEALFLGLKPIIENSKYRFEIDCINDGSKDQTMTSLMLWQQEMPQIRIINLSRNFGKEAALSAGLHHARGDAVIPLDADLQDPPHLIQEMIDIWQSGAKMVLAKRIDRTQESWFKRSSAKWFYKLMTMLSDVALPENVGDFRLMDRQVVEVIKTLPEKNLFMKGLMSWPGFRPMIIEYVRPERKIGDSKINFIKLFRLALNGIFAFSSAPLKVWIYIGFSIASLSFIYGVYLIQRTIFTGIDLPGYASMMVTLLFASGLQMLSTGIIGEYVARIYEEVKGRPSYVIEKIYEYKKQK